MVDHLIQIGYNSSTVSKQGHTMKLKIGSRISWVSAAGELSGEIYNIVLDLNAADHTVPWIDIKIQDRTGLRMCATDEYLKQMRVELIG